MQQKNLGVIAPKLADTDYVAGQETGIQYEEVNKSGNWKAHLPIGEPQFFGFDSSACVSFSALNVIEVQLNYLLNAGKIPDDKLKQLKDWGYLQNDKFNFSDRFTAKMSGTTPQGNQVQSVWDSIRKHGLVPEAMWPSEGKNWAEYYREIPQQTKDFGLNFLKFFDVKYEWIVINNCGTPVLEYLKHHLKQAPLQPAHPVGYRDQQTQVFKNPGVCVTQHATTIYGVDELIRDFDHYSPFTNDYELSYTFPWIMKGVITLKKDEPQQPVFDHVFTKDIHFGERSEEVLNLQKALNLFGYKIPILPDALNRGFYGNITRAAVKDFQYKYKVASLPVLAWNNGKHVYELTRGKLNELLQVKN